MNALNAILFGLVALSVHFTKGYESRQYTSLGTFTPPGRDAFEVRSYAPTVVAEKCGRRSFMYLAEYIGVTGAAENSRGEKIAMTVPVINYSKNKQMCMQFVLPQSVYGSDASSAPAPIDKKVKVVAKPQMTMAYVTFTGGKRNHRVYSWVLTGLYKSLKEMVKSESFEWEIEKPMYMEAYEYSGPETPNAMKKHAVAIRLQKKN